MLAFLWPAAASAQAQGASCTTTGATAPGTRASGGQNLICNGSSWQYIPYQFGVGGTCKAATEGQIEYAGSAFDSCNSSNSWAAIPTASVTLSDLFSAATTNTIDSTLNAQTWQWGTLSTQTALTLTSSSLTSGTLLSLANTSSAANAGAVLIITNSQAGATTGLSATDSGVANTGYAAYFVDTMSSTSASSYAVYAKDTSNHGYAGGFNGTVEIPSGAYIHFNTNGFLQYSSSAPAGIQWSDASNEPLVFKTTGVAPIIMATNNTQVLKITTTQSVGIGTATPAVTLEVNGEMQIDSFATATSTNLCRSTTGSSAGILASCSSSIRYKEQIEDSALGLNEVMEMRPVTFKWKGRDEHDFGFVAEEMAKINPLFVTYDRGRIEGVKYSQLTAVLVKAVQEQQAEIRALNSGVDDLETRH
jgi:hypothetical protein